MGDQERFSRRRFLEHSAKAAAGVAVPYVLCGDLLAAPGQPGANDRIGVGYVGVGRRGNQLMGLPKEGRIVAVSDVDATRANAAAAKCRCKAYLDYRKMLEAKDLDAVVVATPDHWHALPSIHACQAGKDVYCEKPLSLTIREGRAMVAAARKYRRVFQTGSQRRSMKNHRIGCALVRSSRIGKVHTVIGSNYPSPWESNLPAQPLPKGLDWDAWCGQTEPAAYHKDIYIQRADPGWISLRPYSGGEMTGTGAHGLDQIQWALDMDPTGPVEVWAEGGKIPAVVYSRPESRQRGDALCSQGRRVTFRYANGVTVKLDNGSVCGGIFIGEGGKVMIGCNSFDSDPPEIAQQPLEGIDDHLYVSDNHMQNWFDCIKSREKPAADVEIGHRSAIVCHLGNIVRWVGRKLRWDPDKEIFPGDEEANCYVDRPKRKGYELPDPV